jgi:hypothetical protein
MLSRKTSSARPSRERSLEGGRTIAKMNRGLANPALEGRIRQVEDEATEPGGKNSLGGAGEASVGSGRPNWEKEMATRALEMRNLQLPHMTGQGSALSRWFLCNAFKKFNGEGAPSSQGFRPGTHRREGRHPDYTSSKGGLAGSQQRGAKGARIRPE